MKMPKRSQLIICCLMLCVVLSSCSIVNKNRTYTYSKLAEEYAELEDYEYGSAEYRAFCVGFDAGWDQHSERHNEESAWEQGHSDGYREGHSDGYDEGYNQGYSEGYEEGVGYCYDEIRKSFQDTFDDGLHEGYFVGYYDAQKGEKCKYNLYDYDWYPNYFEEGVDNGYKCGYVYGYIIGYSNYQAGIEYYDDMFY